MRPRLRVVPLLAALGLTAQLLAVKSFVPTFIKVLNWLANYYTKHQGTMNTYMNAAQIAAAESVVTAQAPFAGVQIHEQP